MSIGKFSAVILLLTVWLNVNCSNLFSEKKVSSFRVQKLHEQIRSGDFKQIYAESSKHLRSRFSEDEFLRLMNEAVAKMKDIDETLTFHESEGDTLLAQMMNVENRYSVKTEKLERNGKRLEIILHWSKADGNGEFRFIGLAILEYPESGNREPFYI